MFVRPFWGLNPALTVHGQAVADYFQILGTQNAQSPTRMACACSIARSLDVKTAGIATRYPIATTTEPPLALDVGAGKTGTAKCSGILTALSE
jgi:hypothetical protein